jgi:hypothetical protein
MRLGFGVFENSGAISLKKSVLVLRFSEARSIEGPECWMKMQKGAWEGAFAAHASLK